MLYEIRCFEYFPQDFRVLQAKDEHDEVEVEVAPSRLTRCESGYRSSILLSITLPHEVKDLLKSQIR